MKKKSLTIKEIARLSGVSIGTVSRIINETNRGYSQETYQKVKAVIEETDYVPNHMARALITNRTSTVGLVMMNILNPFFPEIARGIDKVATRHDLGILLCNSNDDIRREGRHLELLKEKNVDGIILTTSSLWNNPNIDLLLQSQIPFVIIDADTAGSCYYNIAVDHYQGAKTIVNYLISLGHRRIACITGPSKTESSQLRCSGYKHALAEHKLGIHPELIVEGEYTAQSGEQAMNILDGRDYTAVFACNDMMALGVYKWLHARGLRIPGDVSVVGFDDISIASMMDPPLTTMRQPAYEMGKGAMELLLEAMNDDAGDLTGGKTFELVLAQRGSASFPSK